MFGFASAISEFKRSKITNVPTESGLTQEQYADVEEFNKSTNLKRPIVSKVVQIINGKLYLAAVQLNTLDFTNPNEGIKNLVFSEKGDFLGVINNRF